LHGNIILENIIRILASLGHIIASILLGETIEFGLTRRRLLQHKVPIHPHRSHRVNRITLNIILTNLS
jgi:hypothetical protein